MPGGAGEVLVGEPATRFERADPITLLGGPQRGHAAAESRADHEDVVVHAEHSAPLVGSLSTIGGALRAREYFSVPEHGEVLTGVLLLAEPGDVVPGALAACDGMGELIRLDAHRRERANGTLGHIDAAKVPLARPAGPEPLWREVVGRRVRALRRDRGERLADTARRAGISPQYLSEVERGRKDPSSEILAAVAGALEVPLRDLIGLAHADLARGAGSRGPVLLAA